MEYKNILKKVGLLIIICIMLVISAKLFMFYIPFLIAYIISIIVDPIIKFINKKTDLSRKTSSIIVLVTVFGILIGLISWGTIRLISESTNLLSALNTYLEKAIDGMEWAMQNINMDKLAISDEIKEMVQSVSSDVLNRVIEFIKNLLTNFLEYLKSVPTIFIYTVITILATYFITSDKFYIWDRLEHHIPKKILGKISVKMQKIISSLRRIFKSTNNHGWDIFCYCINGIEYILFIWYECWLSTYYGIIYWICRCFTYIRCRNSNDSLEYYSVSK